VRAGDGGLPGDMIDIPIDMPEVFDPKCFGKTPFRICLQNVPSGSLTLPTNINTGDVGNGRCTSITGGSIEMVTGAEACVLAAADITASGMDVGVTGPRPLVLLATQSIMVSTMNFDATSGSGISGGTGPNANPTDCAPAASMDGDPGDTGGGGGGAGGSFGARGGNGGAGVNGNAPGGKAKPADTSFDKLRGGCAGGTGKGPNGSAGPGSGGGALYLASQGSIVISGTINASGAGGEGGIAGRGGGGGGGSGGMIVLFAPTLSINASGKVFANGGGGGGGAGNGITDGSPGDDALVIDMPARGGAAGDTQGTAGGNGGYKAMAAASASAAMQGGGGGGGAVGVIRILSGQTVAPINVSPTPIAN
jgi:hypothetical protein